MLGVRVIFNNDVTIPWLTDGTADWLWPAAEKAGVPIMFFAPGRVSMFARIAEHHPQLTLIIDHMGLTAAMAKDNSIPAAVDQAVALAARDSERLLRCVAEAEELGGEDPFTPEVLEELGKLVRADWVTYCE